MAQWLARGTAVVGVLVLEWVSYGYGLPTAASPLPAPQTQAVRTQARPAALKNGEHGRTFETLAQLPLRFEANAGQFDERHPLRGARRRLRRRPDADRRDAEPDVADGRDQPRWR